jgi:glycosyltransferase involved in cell wall biosynthesis
LKPVRILWCETYDDRTVGGSHACMFNVATRLDPARFAVVAGFCRPNAYVPRLAAAGIPSVFFPGLVWRKPGLPGRIAAFVNRRRLPGAVRKILADQRIDLLVLNNSVFAGDGFLETCFERGVPIVAYERGLGPLGPHKDPVVALTPRLGASIAISEVCREHMARTGFRTPRIEVIYDGIDLDRTSAAAPATVRGALGLGPRDTVLGMIGNVRQWKGQHVFVEAFASLAQNRPELRGLIVGGWSSHDREYHDRITGRIEELGLTDRLRLLGFRNDVPDLLQAMDVVVHASTSPEPWGMVLVEAMAANRPVVATAMGGPPEMLDHGRCGELVPPEDAQAMARSIARYLDDPAYRTETVKRARARVEERYQLRDTVARTAALFDQVARAR